MLKPPTNDSVVARSALAAVLACAGCGGAPERASEAPGVAAEA